MANTSFSLLTCARNWNTTWRKTATKTYDGYKFNEKICTEDEKCTTTKNAIEYGNKCEKVEYSFTENWLAIMSFPSIYLFVRLHIRKMYVMKWNTICRPNHLTYLICKIFETFFCCCCSAPVSSRRRRCHFNECCHLFYSNYSISWNIFFSVLNRTKWTFLVSFDSVIIVCFFFLLHFLYYDILWDLNEHFDLITPHLKDICHLCAWHFIAGGTVKSVYFDIG